jgi:hypothetical protein
VEEISIGIEESYDSIEYVSSSRQKIKRLLGEWHKEIKLSRKGEMSEQKAKDIERETHELSRIINILAKVCINPKIDPHEEEGEASTVLS